jgi:hypothetical protein
MIPLAQARGSFVLIYSAQILRWLLWLLMRSLYRCIQLSSESQRIPFWTEASFEGHPVGFSSLDSLTVLNQI